MGETQLNFNTDPCPTGVAHSGQSIPTSSTAAVPRNQTARSAQHQILEMVEYSPSSLNTFGLADAGANDEQRSVTTNASSLAPERTNASNPGPGLYCNLATCMCGKRFEDVETRRRHRQYRRDLHSQRFKCHHCGKVFGSGKNLTNHLNSYLPQSIKPYRCAKCMRGLSSRDALRKHEFKCARIGSVEIAVSASLSLTTGM